MLLRELSIGCSSSIVHSMTVLLRVRCYSIYTYLAFQTIVRRSAGCLNTGWMSGVVYLQTDVLMVEHREVYLEAASFRGEQMFEGPSALVAEAASLKRLLQNIYILFPRYSPSTVRSNKVLRCSSCWRAAVNAVLSAGNCDQPFPIRSYRVNLHVSARWWTEPSFMVPMSGSSVVKPLEPGCPLVWRTTEASSAPELHTVLSLNLGQVDLLHPDQRSFRRPLGCLLAL